MTHDEFIIKLQEYYEPFKNDTVDMVTTKYITDKFPENKLDSIFKKIVLNWKYKNCPTPAVLEEMFNEQDKTEIEALQAWEEVNRKVDSDSNIIFADIRIQETIRSMGGWVAFCQRPNLPDYEVWAKKEFVHCFKLYTKNKPKTQTRELLGRYHGGKHRTIYVGNVDKKLLEKNKNMDQIENKINSNLKVIK